MASYYVVKSGGRNDVSKVIYNMPLKTSLEDVSGYDRVSIYNNGDTAQTITVANGLYLYNNDVKLDMGFLNDIIDNKFVIDFDFQYQSTGTSKNPKLRRFMWWYPFGISVANNSSQSLNYIAIAQYSTSATFNTTNKYNDMLWHHMTVFVDLNTKTFTMSIDNGVETLSIDISSALDPSIYLGEKDYGLNGYIRNFIITTDINFFWRSDFISVDTIYEQGSIWNNTPAERISVIKFATPVAIGTFTANSAVKIYGAGNDGITYGWNFTINTPENNDKKYQLYIGVSAEGGTFDLAYVEINGVQIGSYATPSGTLTNHSIPLNLAAGDNIVTVKYKKDKSTSKGDDCVYIYGLEVKEFVFEQK